MSSTGKLSRPKSFVEGQSYGVIDRRTGYPISFGTVISDTLSDDYDVIELSPPSPGQIWNPMIRKYEDYVPTQEELDAKKDAEDEVTRRKNDESRISELRKKVGPGKTGLTQDERDELNVISASLQLNSF